MKNILIYGASGHAKMIVDSIQKNHTYAMKGFIDSYKLINEVVFGHSIIGDLKQLPDIVKQLNIEGIVIGIGDNSTRKAAYQKIKKIAPQLEFVSIIHPSATIALDVSIPEGTVIMPNAVINANAKVGRFCILNTASTLGHDCKMADFSSLASGVTVAGSVQIGAGSAVCLGATIIQNLTIGDNTVIGAGSLVLKSIGNNKMAYGAPIHTIKDRSPNSKYLG
ncbi:sugar O-acyltransferase (sialic acid O-acetyltransferase NeuD family) [Gelidibacter algens]|jgi:sugar O-acyltransferase (sialic acid O-acetyltransferase NeuD family)|uniref:Sugar O-acyltransferase (Sialic acid O-acetyltransferase NeuD family) n=1 Tax=Gelidibacter algens TaxID=49280 RepID=A0A1A7R6R5_9FLAO|nr:acetyltransferase [Gelidibacter algens]OBX27188.1 hypothetical protein A9996_00195 [Gelidibacter algens]RAJ22039.1 sugar O-acyltransferase (sialic acid O-acetyltransferase NeuD family) [Gelidibacter algens]